MVSSEVVLVILKISPLLLILVLRKLSGSHKTKWDSIQPEPVDNEESREISEYLEWSVFIRDWLDSRSLLTGATLYAALIFLWYLYRQSQNGESIEIYVFLILFSIGLLVITFVYVEWFFEGRDPHTYYRSYYVPEQKGPTHLQRLLWPKLHTYVIDLLLISAIVYVETMVIPTTSLF
jgi:hypothetical protein